MKDAITNGCDVLLIGYEDQENLGLRSIAAFLTGHGVRAKIEPYDRSLKDNILARIRMENPGIVGFSLIFQRMLFEFADLMTYLRQNGVTAHFTVGGHFTSIEFERTLELIPELDSVVRHEGEQTLLELFHSVDQHDSWSQIKGLVYRDDGRIKVTPPRPLIQDLDSIPPPVRSGTITTHRGLGICSILGSRGCYYNCSFCSIQEFYGEAPGPKRRSRSPSNIVCEMKQLFSERGIRIFIFQDDCWCMKGHKHQQWIRDFVRELKKEKISDQILWRISCRVDDVNAELISRMKEVGLMCIYIGIESGSNQGLKTFNKHYAVDDVYKALGTLRELKMPFEYGFMIFDPDSTMATVKENIAFLKEIGRDGQVIAHFCKMVPYAGTSIARRLEEEGRLEGTVNSPDYNYNDSRLNLLQLFFSQTFNFRNFDNNGLVERLRLAKFDAIVLNKFFSDRCDARAYTQAVRDLTRQSNESALEVMSMAANFMEMQNEEEILDNWQFLENLAREEKYTEMRIASDLDRLTSRYDFEEGI